MREGNKKDKDEEEGEEKNMLRETSRLYISFLTGSYN